MSDNTQSTNPANPTKEEDRRFGQPHHGHANGEAGEPAFKVTDDQGRLIENFISGRTFASEAFLRDAVAKLGPEKPIVVGALQGMAVSCVRVDEPDNKYGPYVKLKGQFRATSAITGEITEANWAILPGKAAGDMAEVAFTGDEDRPAAQRLLLDLEIGVVGTLKGFPYRWSIRSFEIERSEAQRVVDAISARAQARQQARLAGPAKATD